MLLVKHQPKSLPHGASDNETSHGAKPRLTAVFRGQPDIQTPSSVPGWTTPQHCPGDWRCVGEQQTLWLRLVCQIHGCIVRTGYRTDNMAEKWFFPVVTHGTTAVQKAFSFPETARVQKHIAATLEKKQGSVSPYNVIIFTLYSDLSR